ncbi:MAG: LysR family transcriptional regulator [Bacteroidota bacterium]|jgi:DNA-binding transcriptional LysR family regulator
MTLRQLETLYAIMRAGSITAAARNLHVTQPAVSAVLKHAEQQLGMKLFERIGGRLHPTPEALSLLPDLEEIFGRIDTVSRAMQELRDGRTGRLVVATSPTLVNALLPQAIAALRAATPRLNVIVHSLPTPLAIARVSRREADLGLVYAPVADAALDAEDLLVTEMAVVVPRGHPLARQSAIHARDIADESVISTGPGTRLGALVEEAARREGATPPSIGIEASSSLAACMMVSCGAGVGLVDRSIELSGRFDDLEFRPFRPRIDVRIQLCFPRDRPRSRASLQLAEWLQRKYR